MANTSLPNLTERTATANSDLIHVNSGGTDYKETKANFLSDVNSSISALNNSLTNSSISVNAGNSAVTVTRSNSYKWGNIIVVAVRFQVTSALAIYDYVLQIPSAYRIVSDVYAPLMSSYFTTMADKGLYADAGSYTIRASAAIPSGNYSAYIPLLVRNA